MIKKKIALLLAVVMVFGILSACGKKEDNGNQTNTNNTNTKNENKNNERQKGNVEDKVDTSERITLKVHYGYGYSNEFAIDQTTVGKMLLDKHNIELIVDNAGNNDPTQKEALMIAGENYPDIIMASDQMSTKLIEAGAYIPLNDYIEKSPNIKKAMTRTEDMLKAVTKEDGNIYFLPGSPAVEDNAPGFAYYMQFAVLQEFGFPKVTTFEQYFDLIARYKEKYATIDGMDTIGFTVQSQGWKFDSITNPTGFLWGYPNDGSYLVDLQADNTVKVRINSGSDNEKMYMKKMNEFYNAGLIDGEGFTEQTDQWIAKMASGRVLGYAGWSYEVTSITAQLENDGKWERGFVPVNIAWQDGISTKYSGMSHTNTLSGLGISVNCKYPERVMAFLDDFMSDESQKLITWGIEGTDYTVDANGKMTLNQEQWDNLKNPDYSNKVGYQGKAFGKGWPSQSQFGLYDDGNVVNPRQTPEGIAESYFRVDREFLDKMGYATYKEMFVPYDSPYGPAWSVSFDSESEEGKIAQRRTDIVLVETTNLIMGSVDGFESTWDNYAKKLANLGLETLAKGVEGKLNLRIAEGRYGE